MKKTVFAGIPLGLALLAPLPAAAQDKSPAAIAASHAELRAKIQNDKKGIVTKNLALTDAEAKKFWPIYEDFQKKLVGPRTEMNRAVLDYVNAEASMTDANARRLIDQVAQAQAAEAKAFANMRTKVMKALPGKKAARYIQIENKIRILGEYDIAAVIPLVP